MSFDTLGLSEPLLRAVREKGYNTPSPIQAQAIPAVLKGLDIMAAAQTGTGKTAGFTLPLLQRLMKGHSAKPNSVRALVLTPTRELAAQVHDSVLTYGKHVDLRSAVVFGGVSINPQMKSLRRGVDVLVATPGRLLDLYNQNAVKFNQLEVLVLDEADRMLDMGFIHDIKKVLRLLPERRQNLLFSATFSGDIRNLAKGLLNSPVEIDVAPRNITTELVEQVVHPVDKDKKSSLLSHLIRSEGWRQAIVFSRTKHGANRLADYLSKDGISAAAIHGNKSQSARTKALSEFKQGKVSILVATDIAARGLDIQQLPQVVNFDLPNVPEDYVHRIGRTGRAGMTGHAISLVSADESKQLRDIETVIQRQLNREEIVGFEPKEKLSATKPRAEKGRGEGRGKGRRTAAESSAGSARSNQSRPARRDDNRPGARSQPAGQQRDGQGQRRNTKPRAPRPYDNELREEQRREFEVREARERQDNGQQKSRPGSQGKGRSGVAVSTQGERPQGPSRKSLGTRIRDWAQRSA